MEKVKNDKEKTMDKELVKRKVKRAIDKLIENDEFLLQNDVYERSITHKLAEYLQQEFIYWTVDCEYNRNMDGEDVNDRKKRLKVLKQIKHNNDKYKDTDIEGTTIYPDIIIHQRGYNNTNLLVIEVKKSNSNIATKDYDIHKLEELTKKPYKYKNTLFIEFHVGDEYKKEQPYILDWDPKINH